MNLAIGVMGSSEGDFSQDVLSRMERLGRAIAQKGCTLITGGCPGLSYEAVKGAKAEGGFVVGISPGLSRYEHVTKYESPIEGFDVMIYTGSGLMGREIENIRSSDIVIIAGGRSGTLGEFSIAYDEGKLIGALKGTGGIADSLDYLVELCDKDTGAVVMSEEDPERLVEKLYDYYCTCHYKHPSTFEPVQDEMPTVLDIG